LLIIKYFPTAAYRANDLDHTYESVRHDSMIYNPSYSQSCPKTETNISHAATNEDPNENPDNFYDLL